MAIETAVPSIHVVGGGLAGAEAAWQCAEAGWPVVLHEMRPVRSTAAHGSDRLAELVCSNSFRADDPQTSAIGILHREMRALGSLIISAADRHKLPAGGALAVDRDGFAAEVTARIEAHPRIALVREEVTVLPPVEWGETIVATGPLTAPALAEALRQETGEADLAFFDAIAPVVHRETIDMSRAWFQSRYDKAGPAGTGADYINCALTREQYDGFIDALLAAEVAADKAEGDTPYFNGCLPIEVMATRGRETLRHGPMKPFGLTNPHDPTRKPYAVVQLRQDNALGTLYNIVGFQTKMKHGAQTDILRAIPGLEQARFARLGGLHRNTFLNSPKVLDAQLRLRALPRLRFAGQITGCEGYVESAAIGLVAGRLSAAARSGRVLAPLPPTTAIGALLAHITGGHLQRIDAGPQSFQPMNVNFGLFPPLTAPLVPEGGKRLRGHEKDLAKRAALSARAAEDLQAWCEGARLADIAA